MTKLSAYEDTWDEAEACQVDPERFLETVRRIGGMAATGNPDSTA